MVEALVATRGLTTRARDAYDQVSEDGGAADFWMNDALSAAIERSERVIA